jgi:5-dehydro-2-deoxygluconokinase
MDDGRSAAYWHGMGAKIVVIKHGKEGSTAYSCDGGKYSIKPFPVEKLKSFGGGDGYGSSFLYGVLEGLELIDCLELGSASASLLVASHGCAPYMPTLEKLKEFIAGCKRQYGEMIARE